MSRIINVNGELDVYSLGLIEKRFDKLVSCDPHGRITFLFRNCLGGDVNAVFGFIDRIIASGVPVRTRNIGKIYSAAVILFLVGQKREGSNGCEFKLHPFKVNPEEVSFLNLEGDFDSWLGNVRKLRSRVTRFIVDRTRLSVSEVFHFFSSHKFHFDMESAQKFGILKNPDMSKSEK